MKTDLFKAKNLKSTNFLQDVYYFKLSLLISQVNPVLFAAVYLEDFSQQSTSFSRNTVPEASLRGMLSRVL